jgi:G3E family GTPase
MSGPELTDKSAAPRIPITVLTGFLGTGKTTLLRAYLEEQTPGMVAVVINEYGSTQIDGDLVAFSGFTAAIETTVGCLCCTVSGDVLETLAAFSRAISDGEMAPIGQVIIETTGLADPMSLVHALKTAPDLAAVYRFDRTVTLVDAIKGEHWIEKFPECRHQILLADIVILSKTDLIDDPISKRELHNLKTQIQQLNPVAEVIDAADQTAIVLLDPSAMHAGAQLTRLPEQSAHRHHHAHGVESFTVEINPDLSINALKRNLIRLGEHLGRDLLRVKGFIAGSKTDHDSELVQGVGGQFEFTSAPPRADNRSELVFITNAIDRDAALIALEATS